MRGRVLWALAALVVLAATACASSPPVSQTSMASNLSSPTPLLPAAIKHAVHLGPAGSATQVDLTLGLKVGFDRLVVGASCRDSVTNSSEQIRFPESIKPSGKVIDSAALVTEAGNLFFAVRVGGGDRHGGVTVELPFVEDSARFGEPGAGDPKLTTPSDRERPVTSACATGLGR